MKRQLLPSNGTGRDVDVWTHHETTGGMLDRPFVGFCAICVDAVSFGQVMNRRSPPSWFANFSNG